jgi:predicted lactoylglutathione lyase
MDMKLEVLILPVSDVDRAKAFYDKLGFASISMPARTTTGSYSSRRPVRMPRLSSAKG